MKSSTWSTPIPDAPMSDRAWRLDHVAVHTNSSKITEAAELGSRSDAGRIDPGAGSRPRSRALGFIPRWNQTFRTWLRVWLDGFEGLNVRFENVLHQFAATIATVDDPALV